MKIDLEHNHARLELRVLELEDAVATLTQVVKGLNEMSGHFNRILGHYADTLGGVVLALPHATRRLPLWPVASAPFTGCSGCEGATPPDTPGDTPV